MAFGLAMWVLEDSSNKAGDQASTPSSSPYVNLNPPTEEEKQQAEDHKKDLSNPPTSKPPTTPSGKTQVTPVITSATQNEVRAFVQGVIEDGGTCSAILTKGPSSITKTSSGIANVSYTTCQPIDISGSLTKGTWTLKVSYSSAKAEGSSASQTLEVQ